MSPSIGFYTLLRYVKILFRMKTYKFAQCTCILAVVVAKCKYICGKYTIMLQKQ